MKEHEVILKMIEDVSPDDSETLRKIDILVLRYITGVDVHDYDIDYDDSIYATDADGNEVDLGKCWYYSQIDFTESRVALKDIRPNWCFCINGCELGYFCSMFTGKPEEYIRWKAGQYFPTEELAELHAIIQAIAYEREKHETV